MKISKRVKKGCALSLALMLGVSCFGLMQKTTHAATAIKTDADCSLKVLVEESEYLEDFKAMQIPVSVYRVADVDTVGNYTATGIFSEMEFKINDKTNAADWQNMAKEAEGYLKTENEEGEITINTEAAGSTTVEAAGKGVEGVIDNLTPGMYLVVPEATYNENYSVRYSFTPYLTALPGNQYANVGGEGYGHGDDEWNYHPEIGLKPAAEPQKGSIRIVKTLENYNETLGKTSFAFRIIGYDGNVEVYNNVVSITCPGEDGSLTQSTIVSGIPVGLRMVVTEEYTGASYELVSSEMIHDIIVSDVANETDPNNWPMAEAQFINRYDGGNRGGYGVTNHFDLTDDPDDPEGEKLWGWDNPTTPNTPVED